MDRGHSRRYPTSLHQRSRRPNFRSVMHRTGKEVVIPCATVDIAFGLPILPFICYAVIIPAQRRVFSFGLSVSPSVFLCLLMCLTPPRGFITEKLSPIRSESPWWVAFHCVFGLPEQTLSSKMASKNGYFCTFFIHFVRITPLRSVIPKKQRNTTHAIILKVDDGVFSLSERLTFCWKWPLNRLILH